MKAPESLQKEIYTKESDVFTFGIIVWQISYKQLDPYPKYDSLIDAQIAIIEGTRPVIADEIDAEVKTVIILS